MMVCVRARLMRMKEMKAREPAVARGLPGELRHLLARAPEIPEVLVHAARGLERPLMELGIAAEARDLRRAAAELRAQAGFAACQLGEIVALAGRLEGLAWAMEVQELGD